MTAWTDFKDWAKQGAKDFAGGTKKTFLEGGSKVAAKYIKSRYTTVAVLIFIGSIVGFIGTPAIPALGLPTIKAFWIGMALIMYAFYHILPGRHQIMADIRRGSNWICPYTLQTDAYGGVLCEKEEDTAECKLSNPPTCEGKGRSHPKVSMNPKRTWMELEGVHYGALYGRSFLKILAVSFTALEFSPLSTFPFKHILIPIIFLFWAYFSMPTGYKKSEPYKAAEAWFRMALGVTLAVLVMTFLTPNPGATFTGVFWVQFASLFFGVLIIGLITLFASQVFKETKTALVIIVTCVLFILAMPVLGAVAGTAMNMPGVSAFYLMLAFFTAMPERTKEEGGEEETKIMVKFVKDISDTLNNQ
ncbi:MAG: hypothetical protein QXD77_01835, partial [Candidatus Aenigmatarchaeota archaeon]